MRGPDSHLLAARHDPAIISQCPDEGNTSSEPPRKLSLLNLLQMSKDISAGMEYLASKVRWRSVLLWNEAYLKLYKCILKGLRGITQLKLVFYRFQFP